MTMEESEYTSDSLETVFLLIGIFVSYLGLVPILTFYIGHLLPLLWAFIISMIILTLIFIIFIGMGAGMMVHAMEMAK